MDKNGESYRIVSLIGKLFDSLESTDLVARQLGKMRLVYELNQANMHFSQILEDAKTKPQLGLDYIDEMRRIVDGCKAPTDSRLLTGNDGGTKNVIDYLQPALEQVGTENMHKDLYKDMRSVIDVIVMHVAFTDNVMNIAINNGADELRRLLAEIDLVLKEGKWSDESYCKFAADALKRWSRFTVALDKDIQQLIEQMGHEDKITEEYLDDVLKEKLMVLLRSDFADTTWCRFTESALTRKCGGMRDFVKDCEGWEQLKEKMYVCASVMENNGKSFVYKATDKLGRYLYKHRKSYSQKVKALDDYFKFVYFIEDKRRIIKIEEEGVKIESVEDSQDGITEKEIADSGIKNNARLFLKLLKKMGARDFSGKAWLLLFSIAKNHEKFGYEGKLTNFYEKVIQGIIGCDISYTGVNKSLNSVMPRNDADIRKKKKNILITKNNEWKNDKFVKEQLAKDKQAKSFLYSVEEYFRQKLAETVEG